MANTTSDSSSLPADLEKLRTMLVNDLKCMIDDALAPLADSINKLCETTEDHDCLFTDLEEGTDPVRVLLRFFGNSTNSGLGALSWHTALRAHLQEWFHMIFPALLKVDYKGETHSFNAADEAQKFYDWIDLSHGTDQ